LLSAIEFVVLPLLPRELRAGRRPPRNFDRELNQASTAGSSCSCTGLDWLAVGAQPLDLDLLAADLVAHGLDMIAADLL
jgi:hypothetical protein